MPRRHLNAMSDRITSVHGDVAQRVERSVGEVGRRIEDLSGEVHELRRELASSLPAETVTALVKGAVMFLRAAAITIILGGVIIGLTTQLRPDTWMGFLAPHKTKLILGEIGLFGVLSIELLVRSVSQYLKSKNAQQAAFMFRVVIRTACYAVLMVSVVSLLAASPALAIGVGSVTGLIIGLSAQATVGNAVAGTVIAIARPFRIGDEITVMGVTGKVIEIAVMHTILETPERRILVPSTTLMTQVVQRTKPESERQVAAAAQNGATVGATTGVDLQSAQAQAATAAAAATFAAEGAERAAARRRAEQQRRDSERPAELGKKD